MVVSPGGRLYEDMEPTQYPLVEIATGAVRSGLAATSELSLHQAIYQALPDTVSVVHTHSKYAAAFAVARVDLPFVCNENIGPGSEFVLVTDPYAAPGTTALGAQAVATFARQPGSRAVLLANHGVVAIGDSVAQAYTIAEQVEWIAEVTHHASTLRHDLRGVVTIPSDQQDLIGRKLRVQRRTRAPPLTPTRHLFHSNAAPVSLQLQLGAFRDRRLLRDLSHTRRNTERRRQ